MTDRSVAVVHQDSTYAVAAVAEAAARELELRFSLAAKYPRDEGARCASILELVEDPTFAADALYDVERGSETVAGLSVRFTEAALQIWGHVSTVIEILQESETLRIGRVGVTDCQTGTSYTGAVALRKVVERYDAGGRRVLETRTKTKWNRGQKTDVPFYVCAATDDDVRERWENAVSKTFRGLGLRVLPAALRAACFARAKVVAPPAERDRRRKGKRGGERAPAATGTTPPPAADAAQALHARLVAAGLNDSQILALAGDLQRLAPGARRWVEDAAKAIAAGRPLEDFLEARRASVLLARAHERALDLNGGDIEAAEHTMAEAAAAAHCDRRVPTMATAQRVLDVVEGMGR